MLTGKQFKYAVISAANNIQNNRERVDALNVFPVPDGDTGSNMSLTMSAAAREVMLLDDDTPLGVVAKTVSSALLRGARGNSGVILSLIFRGMSRAYTDLESGDAAQVALSFEKGAARAYKAVMQPMEGTILTVVRVASEKAREYADKSDPNDSLGTFKCALDAARDALAKTPEMLPVLKKAGVVDAGGQGLVIVLEGMYTFFSTGKIIQNESGPSSTQGVTPAQGTVETDEIKFGYCTEFLIQKNTDKKTDDCEKFKKYLYSVGDCVVAVEDGDIIKVHVHSNKPGEIITKALKIGELVNIKIDNMRQEHRDTLQIAPKKTVDIESAQTDDDAPPEKKYGFVAVASGEGISQMFLELGCDNIVSGGQTMNPSTDDILHAIQKTPAETVFVLPNNKNIIMSAEQAVKFSKKKVIVVPSVTIPQGIRVMLTFDEDAGSDDNAIAMRNCLKDVSTAQITFAARDASIDGTAVKKNDIMGMENGKITVVGNDLKTVAFKTIKNLTNKSTSMITIFYGENVEEQQANELGDLVRSKIKNVEVSLINGGQSVYYYIISVEQ